MDYKKNNMSTDRENGMYGLQGEQHEHGQGKWEGGQKGTSDKRMTESKVILRIIIFRG
jgi:hypothetical protein